MVTTALMMAARHHDNARRTANVRTANVRAAHVMTAAMHAAMAHAVTVHALRRSGSGYGEDRRRSGDNQS
jgi:hypothetical protein